MVTARDYLHQCTPDGADVAALNEKQPQPNTDPNVYDFIRTLSEGSYGDVHECIQLASGQRVAIKRFKTAHMDPQVWRLAIREARVLQAMPRHPNVVELKRAVCSQSSGRLYFVFEIMHRNLQQELNTRPGGILPTPSLKHVAWQLLQALAHCHEHKVVHRDIKPANVLISDPPPRLEEADGGDRSGGVGGNLQVKLCDFGFARWLPGAASQAPCAEMAPKGQPQESSAANHGTDDLDTDMSGYVVTRWYRAPEILVGEPYGTAVDVWSYGCTLAELATGEPLFPGTSSADQLWRIVRSLGPLPPSLVARSRSSGRLSAMAPLTGRGRTLAQRLKGVPPPLVELITACLTLDPSRRPSAKDLLWLPYFWDVQRPVVVAAGAAASGSPPGAPVARVARTAGPSPAAAAAGEEGSHPEEALAVRVQGYSQPQPIPARSRCVPASTDTGYYGGSTPADAIAVWHTASEARDSGWPPKVMSSVVRATQEPSRVGGESSRLLATVTCGGHAPGRQTSSGVMSPRTPAALNRGIRTRSSNLSRTGLQRISQYQQQQKQHRLVQQASQTFAGSLDTAAGGGIRRMTTASPAMQSAIGAFMEESGLHRADSSELGDGLLHHLSVPTAADGDTQTAGPARRTAGGVGPYKAGWLHRASRSGVQHHPQAPLRRCDSGVIPRGALTSSTAMGITMSLGTIPAAVRSNSGVFQSPSSPQSPSDAARAPPPLRRGAVSRVDQIAMRMCRPRMTSSAGLVLSTATSLLSSGGHELTSTSGTDFLCPPVAATGGSYRCDSNALAAMSLRRTNLTRPATAPAVRIAAAAPPPTAAITGPLTSREVLCKEEVTSRITADSVKHCDEKPAVCEDGTLVAPENRVVPVAATASAAAAAVATLTSSRHAGKIWQLFSKRANAQNGEGSSKAHRVGSVPARGLSHTDGDSISGSTKSKTARKIASAYHSLKRRMRGLEASALAVP